MIVQHKHAPNHISLTCRTVFLYTTKRTYYINGPPKTRASELGAAFAGLLLGNDFQDERARREDGNHEELNT